ncbi:MAG: hypothetical protein ACI4P7_00860 [Bacilli bacterium]|nr:hypothetical protein [Erysipelotrichaceae bacterium]
MMDKKVLTEEEVTPINLDDDMEKITIDCIKFMLKNKMPLEDIQHITKKSLDEIKRIGGIDD